VVCAANWYFLCLVQNPPPIFVRLVAFFNKFYAQKTVVSTFFSFLMAILFRIFPPLVLIIPFPSLTHHDHLNQPAFPPPQDFFFYEGGVTQNGHWTSSCPVSNSDSSRLSILLCRFLGARLRLTRPAKTLASHLLPKSPSQR